MEIGETYLSIKEFASKLNVHPSTIRRAIKCGKLQAIRIGTGKRSVFRIPISEINRIALFDMEEIIEKIIERKRLSDNIR